MKTVSKNKVSIVNKVLIAIAANLGEFIFTMIITALLIAAVVFVLK